MLVVVAGRAASGKSTIAKRAAMLATAAHSSFGDYVRYLAGPADNDVKRRRRLQQVGQAQVEADPLAFVAAFLKFAGYDPAKLLIVDGLRHDSVLSALIECARLKADRVSVAYVDVSDTVRSERLKERGLTEKEIAEIEAHPSEFDVLHSLRSKAVIVLDGHGDVDREAARLLRAFRSS